MGTDAAVIIQFSSFLEDKTLVVQNRFSRTGVPWWALWAITIPLRPLSITVVMPLGYFTAGRYLDICCLEWRKGIRVGLLRQRVGLTGFRWRWKFDGTKLMEWPQ